MNRKTLLCVFALVCGIVWLLNGHAPVSAAGEIFTVNQTADLPDATTSDNRCDTNASVAGDQCSLRAAIQQANFTSGTQTITFVSTAPHKLTRSGNDNTASLGDLDITGPVNLEGHPPATTIDGNGIDRVFDIFGSQVTMQDLIVRGGHTAAFGGGYQVNTSGNLSLDNVVVRENFGQDNTGGIENFGSLFLDHVTITENETGDNFGGLRSSGTLSIRNSTINNNFGDVDIFDGTATIINSTIGGVGSAVPISLKNVTTSIINCSLFNFTCTTGISLQNSIITGCDGTFVSNGFNLFQETSGCTLTGNLTGNLLNVDPLLGPLQDNGGPTATRALLPGSPAIDAGNPGGCRLNTHVVLTTDQRGFHRPEDGDGDGTAVCDMGAFEVQ